MEASPAQKKYILGLARKAKLFYNTLDDVTLIEKLESDFNMSWPNLDSDQARKIIGGYIKTVNWQRGIRI